MATTRYFAEQVLRKRTYLTESMCRAIVAAPLHTIVQEDGRVRFWGEIQLPGEDRLRTLRVVTLSDGETVHNAFLDRNFRKDER